MKGDLRCASNRAEVKKNESCERQEQPIEPRTRAFGIAGLSCDCRIHIIACDSISVRLTPSGLAPTCMLTTCHRRKRNCPCARRHQKRATDNFCRMSRGCAVQLAEHESSPKESPQLVCIRQRNPAADAQIFRGILLEKITDDPYESAKHQPEKNVFCLR